MDRVQGAWLRTDEALLTAGRSPAPDETDSLFTFMGVRLRQSFENLGCGDFGLTNPVAKLQANGGIVVGVVFARP